MDILLDTHTLLWCLSDPVKLSHKIREEIIKPSNNVYVSPVVIWEIAIKQATGKLTMPENIEEEIRIHRFTPLPISIRHSLRIEQLPDIHKDPFDRMLVAQAMEEKLIIITKDRMIPKYKVRTLKA